MKYHFYANCFLFNANCKIFRKIPYLDGFLHIRVKFYILHAKKSYRRIILDILNSIGSLQLRTYAFRIDEIRENIYAAKDSEKI